MTAPAMTAELVHTFQPGSSVESQPATAAATIIQAISTYFIVISIIMALVHILPRSLRRHKQSNLKSLAGWQSVHASPQLFETVADRHLRD